MSEKKLVRDLSLKTTFKNKWFGGFARLFRK